MRSSAETCRRAPVPMVPQQHKVSRNPACCQTSAPSAGHGIINTSPYGCGNHSLSMSLCLSRTAPEKPWLTDSWDLAMSSSWTFHPSWLPPLTHTLTHNYSSPGTQCIHTIAVDLILNTHISGVKHYYIAHEWPLKQVLCLVFMWGDISSVETKVGYQAHVLIPGSFPYFTDSTGTMQQQK